jgi:hypothetical protein
MRLLLMWVQMSLLRLLDSYVFKTMLRQYLAPVKGQFSQIQ